MGWFCRDGNRGKSGEIQRDREDIGEIHGERIVGFLADLERRRRRDGREHHVNFFERLVEILLDERPHALGFFIVGVIVAGRKDECSEDDAAFCFRPESLALLLEIDIAEEFCFLCVTAGMRA